MLAGARAKARGPTDDLLESGERMLRKWRHRGFRGQTGRSQKIINAEALNIAGVTTARAAAIIQRSRRAAMRRRVFLRYPGASFYAP